MTAAPPDDRENADHREYADHRRNGDYRQNVATAALISVRAMMPMK